MSAEADCVVRNITRRNGIRRNTEIWHRKTKLLKPILSKNCKPFVHLHDPQSRRTNYYISQLVLMCFVTDGELVPIRQIEYVDGDACNCCVENLRIKSL